MISSTLALPHNLCSSMAYSDRRSSPKSEAANKVSSFCSSFGLYVSHSTALISAYGSLPRGCERKAVSFRRVSWSNFDTMYQNLVSADVIPRRWKFASARWNHEEGARRLNVGNCTATLWATGSSDLLLAVAMAPHVADGRCRSWNVDCLKARMRGIPVRGCRLPGWKSNKSFRGQTIKPVKGLVDSRGRPPTSRVDRVSGAGNRVYAGLAYPEFGFTTCENWPQNVFAQKQLNITLFNEQG